MSDMTIGKAARDAGVGVETIRFYERKGLIDRPRKPQSGGYRIYSNETVVRVRFIRQAQQLGFSLREIDDLLSLKTSPGADCNDVRARAIEKREEIVRKLGQLRSMKGALDDLIDACPGRGAVRNCSIIDALSKDTKGHAKDDRHQKVH